jgi:hypothetical protein
LFAALGFMFIHVQYSHLTLCDPLSYVHNMYIYTGKVLEAGSHICVNLKLSLTFQRLALSLSSSKSHKG